MSTSGGIDEQGKWVEVNRVSYDYLHREWQARLFAMLRERVGGTEINAFQFHGVQCRDFKLSHINQRALHPFNHPGYLHYRLNDRRSPPLSSLSPLLPT